MSDPFETRDCVDSAVEFVVHYYKYNNLPDLLITQDDIERFKRQMVTWFGRGEVTKPLSNDALKWGRRNLRAMTDEAVIQLMKDVADEVEERLDDNFGEGAAVGYDSA